MKKRILSSILALSITLSMIPSTVFAADSSWAHSQAAHPDCGAVSVTRAATIRDLRTALSQSGSQDVLLDVRSDTEWTVSSSLTVTGIKHIQVPEGVTVTLKRGRSDIALFSVSGGATLILGDGAIKYNGDTLEAAAQAGTYEVDSTGGSLVIDGGAVWTQGGTDFYFINEHGARTGYTAGGTRATASLISCANGTLDIWEGVTLRNNHLYSTAGQGGGSAINMTNTRGTAPTLNLYGGTVEWCGISGRAENGTGAIYAGPASDTYALWTSNNRDGKYGAINFYAGSVRHNATYRNGGNADGTGIAIDRATLNLYGGEIGYNCGDTGCGTSAADGGGVGARAGALVYLYGGTITNNWTGGFGGGVCLWNSDGYLYGTEISLNKAGYGAGVAIAGCGNSSLSSDSPTKTFSTLYMYGGTISYNEAEKRTSDTNSGVGGGICAGTDGRPNGSVLDLRGGTIQQNKAQNGGGVAAYAGTVTQLKMSGDATIINNSAMYHGNGAYFTNVTRGSANLHSLLVLSGNAQIDTNNPAYFSNVLTGQVPVQVSSALTTTGTAAIFEFADSFWSGSTGSGYSGASAGLDIVRFNTGVDIQENKIALENTSWYLKADTSDSVLELQRFEDTPQYTIRNGTPVAINGKNYYRIYSSLDDAFAEASERDVLYIFYNTTVDRPAALDKSLTLLAESSSSAGVDAALSKGSCAFTDSGYGYYVMAGSFLKYDDPNASGTKYSITGNSASQTNSGPYSIGDISYNIRNDYTITLSSSLYLGEGGKQTVTGHTPEGQAAIVIRDGASLEIGQKAAGGMGAGALTFDGNLSYPQEGPMFQVTGSLILHDGITLKNHANYSEAHPGVIEVARYGKLTINDGVAITGNVSPIAGAVYVDRDAAFTMNGGSISNNIGAMPRYGFLRTDGSKYTGYDTSYWGQAKYYYGAGAVYNMGTLSMYGGSISGNRGEHGALSNAASGTMDLVSGSITSNHALIRSGEGTSYGLSITGYTEGALPSNQDSSGNTLDFSVGAGNGGGLAIGGSKDAHVTVGSGMSVSGNTAVGSGGGIAVGEGAILTKSILTYESVAQGTAQQTITTASGARTVDAAVPSYGSPVGMSETGVEVTFHSGASITDNTAGKMGGGLYAAGNGDSVAAINSGVVLQRNSAAVGGGLAVTRGASVVFSNEITENTASYGGGVYVGGHVDSEEVTTVTAKGRITANSAAHGGGVYVDCLTEAAVANLASETRPMPTDPGYEGGPVPDLGTDASGTSGLLVLDGAYVNNNRLLTNEAGQAGWGIGIYNRGDVRLSAESGPQPTVSYNDQIFLEQGHMATLDSTYNITASGQSRGNKLTFHSRLLDNGTPILQAANESLAGRVLNSGLITHSSRTLNQRAADRTFIEINSAFVHYYTAMPGTGNSVASTYTYAPGATDVYALNFSTAGKNQQSGEVVEGFVLPEGQNLSFWALVGQDPDRGNQWRYITVSNAFTDNVEEALAYTPGSLLDLSSDRVLVACYVDADYYVDTELTHTVLDPTAEADAVMGSLTVENASWDANQNRYYFANGKDLILRPEAVSDGDVQGVLQSMAVYHMISAEEYVPRHPDYYITSYLTTQYYWKRDFTAIMDTESFTQSGEDTAQTVCTTGKIVGLSYADGFDLSRAQVTEDQRAVTYTTSPASILVRAEFKQGMVMLEAKNKAERSEFTGYYDTLYQAYCAMLAKLEANPELANDMFTLSLLAPNTKDAGESYTNGRVCLFGEDSTASGPFSFPSDLGTLHMTVDLNHYTLDAQSLTSMVLDHVNSTLKNGVIVHHTPAGQSALTIAGATLTLEHIRLQAENADYAVYVGQSGHLDIGQNCALGKVFLWTTADDPAPGAADTSAHADVLTGFASKQTAETVATFYLDRWNYASGYRQVLLLDRSVDASTGDLIRTYFQLGDSTGAGNEANWFIGTNGRLYQKVSELVPQIVCGSSGDAGHTAVISETALDTPWVDGYPLYYEYVSQYGYQASEHDIQLSAQMKNGLGEDLRLEDGTVNFFVSLLDSSGRRRHVYNRTASLHYQDGVSSALAQFSALSMLDATGTDTSLDGYRYLIRATWTGAGQYSSQYARYWNANYGKENMDGVSGTSISGTSRLFIAPKPMHHEDVVLVSITPQSAEYVGPAGAANGYTSAPSLGTIRDKATGRLLTRQVDYTPYFVALTSDPAEAAEPNQQLVKDGAVYYYKDNGSGGLIYYTANGSGEKTGADPSNARSLNGADAGVYSVELQAYSQNYTGQSGWKETVFTIHPYSGSLFLSGPNHVMAGKSGDTDRYQVKTEEKFAAALEADAERPLTFSDRYGNRLALENCALDFMTISGGATLSGGWPVSEGLYNLVASAKGHENGTMKLAEQSALNSNYTASASGYMAILVTNSHLNVFLIPETVTVPYTGEIYTDTDIKALDPHPNQASIGSSTEYEVWMVAVDQTTGRPLDTEGNIITDLEKIKTTGRDAQRMSLSEYRLEIGSAQHTPRNVGTYTMVLTDTTGSYRGLGYLQITNRQMQSLTLTPSESPYTGQSHVPGVEVRDSTGASLISDADYVLRISNENVGVIASPIESGTFSYTATGINNYAGAGEQISTQYTVVPKQLDNSDVTAENGLTEVVLDAAKDTLVTGTLLVPMEPEFSLYYHGMTLVRSRDYRYEITNQYGDPVNGITAPGTYRVSIYGLGNYTGTLTYSITAHDATNVGDLTVVNKGSYTYHAGPFADYHWDSATTVTWLDSVGTEHVLDLSRCDLTVSQSIDGSNPIAADTPLDAGLYFIGVTLQADYADQLGMPAGTHHGVGILRIDRRAVTVTVAQASKTYGQLDPEAAYTTYTTDLYQGSSGGTVENGFYSRDKDRMSGSFSRMAGEDVLNDGYHYTLGTFSAGDNYVITVSTATSFRINPKDITLPAFGTDDILTSYQDALAYTGYGLSPISSVVYQAERGNLLLAEGAHYALSYQHWVAGTHAEGVSCRPDDGCDGFWESTNAVPYNVGWYRAILDADAISGDRNNYVGTRALTFQIVAQGGTLDVAVMGGDSATYKAAAYTPAVTVHRSGFSLPVDSYSLSYHFNPADGSAAITGTFVSGSTEFTNAGTYTIYATGSGNFIGSSGSAVFTIAPKSLAADDAADGTKPVTLTIQDAHFVYDEDKAQQAAVNAVYNGVTNSVAATLSNGTDYSLSYRDHINAGTATVVVTGKGNYTGSRALTYSIAPKPLTVTVNGASKVYGTSDPSYTYTVRDEGGTDVTASVRLTGSVQRTPGEDVGSYPFTLDAATLSAGSNYTLTLAGGQSLEITAKSLGDGSAMAENISASIPQFVSVNTNSGDLVSSVSYWASALGRQILASGTDYTVLVKRKDTGAAVSGALSEGIYTVTVSAAVGSKNYSGSFTMDVQAVNADSLITMGSGETVTYRVDGYSKSITPRVGEVVFPGKSVSMTVSYSNGRKPETTTLTTNASGNLTLSLTDAGTYTLVMTTSTGEGDSAKTYFGTVTYVVQPKNIAGGNTDGGGEVTLKALEGDFSYTGEEVKPTNGDNLLRYSGQDIPAASGDIINYIVGYSNNVNPGTNTASLTVYGQGNYTGVRTVNYSIGETRYRVSYNGNGNTEGSAPVSDTLYQKGTQAIIQGNTGGMERRVDGSPAYNAIFLGWSTTQEPVIDSRDDLQSELYLGGSSLTMEHNVTLFAVWAADRNNNGTADCDEDKATVTYQPDMAGDTGMTGTVPVDSNAYINGATVTVLENVGNLSLSGYVLLGWTTKAPSAEGLRLHTSDQYIDFVSANDLYMANRTFTMGTGNVTLYAVWGVDSNHNGKEDWRDNNQFFVVYDANGGTGALPSPEVLEAGVLSVTTADRPAGLLRDGYVQVGWTVNQNGAGAPGELTQEVILTDGGKITISGSEYLYKAFHSAHAIQLGDPNPVILYALWAEDTNRNGQPDYEEDRYTVSYETVADGAAAVSLPTDTGRYLTGASLTLGAEAAAADPTGESLVFLGWSTDRTKAARIYARGEQDYGTLYQPGELFRVDGADMTFYAVWGAANYNAKAYTVTVTAATGGTAKADQTVVLEGKSAVVTITAAAGYVLDRVLVNNTEAVVTDCGNRVYTLTLAKIQADQSVVVSFLKSDFSVAWPDTVIYNGTPQRPVLSITSGGTALEETDFSITVRYNGGAAADFSSARFQDAGTYTITVSGKPDTPYAGSEVTVGYVIRPAELDTLTLELPAAGYTYDGTAKSPAPSVTSKTVVTGDITYVTVYADNRNAGTATVTVTGSGNFTGTLKQTFAIGTADLALAAIPAVTYNGRTQSAVVTVTGVNGTALTAGVDYTLSGTTSATDAGAYAVTASGLGNYGNAETGVFVIRPYGIQTDETLNLRLNQTTFSAGSVDVVSTLTVWDKNGNALASGQYTLFYSSDGAAWESAMPTAPGVYTVKAAAITKGSYDGTYAVGTMAFVITESPFTVTGSPTKTYRGSPYTGADVAGDIIVQADGNTLAEGTDYTLSVTAEDAGRYTVVVTGAGTYAGYAGSAALTIAPAGIDTLVLTPERYTYDGAAKTPAAEVRSGALTATADIRYLNNVNAGTATAVAVGTGNFTGTITEDFVIVKAELTITPGADQGKVYGAGDPSPLTYNTPSVAGAALSGALSRAAGETADQYAYSLGSLRETSGNYDLKLAAGTAFTIRPRSITAAADGVVWAFQGNQTKGYTGSAAEADVALTWGDTILRIGKDYTVTYTAHSGAVLDGSGRPVGVGAYTVTVTGIGNYTDSAAFTLTIVKSILGVSAADAQTVYSGSAQTPGTLTVMAGDTAVTSYTVDYTDGAGHPVAADAMVDAGLYTGTVRAAGYEDATFIFTILPRELTADMISVEAAAYTGSQQRPAVTVADTAPAVVTEADRTIAYGANIAAGPDAGSVTVTGQRNYTGTVTKYFDIASASLAVGSLSGVTYDGLAHQLRPAVSFGDGTLAENVDYTLTYTGDLVNAGEVAVKVTGLGSFTGETTRTYSIAPKALEDSMVSAIADQAYTGSSITPDPVVTYTTADGRVLMLQKGTDYTASYESNISVGTARVVITAVPGGNYSGSVSKSFVITAADGLVVDPVSDAVYDGDAYQPEPKVTFNGSLLSKDTDYTLSYAAQTGSSFTDGKPVNAGSYTVTVTGMGNFTGFARTLNYAITSKPLSEDMVQGLQPSLPYTGTAVTQTGMRLTDSAVPANRQALTENTDYTLAYENNVAVGNASLTITGRGNYSGVLTKTFAIDSSSLFQVVYTANGASGSVPTDSGRYLTGAKAVVRGSGTLGKDGWVFLGWSSTAVTNPVSETPADGFCLPGSEYTIAQSNAILYAVFAPDDNHNGKPDYEDAQYTVSYDGNGHTGGTVPAPAAGLEGTEISVQPAVTREGFRFLGWGTKQLSPVISTDGVQSLSGTLYKPGDVLPLIGNTTLYAVWISEDLLAGNIIVSYDANGGYAEQLPVSTLVVKNGSHTVSSVAPTRANAQFLGWTTERRAVQATDPVTGYYKAGDQLTALTADTTLYALWLEDARYSITYQDLAGVTLGGGASIPVDGNTYFHRVPFTLDGTVLTGTALVGVESKAVTLVGWTTDAAAAGRIYAQISDSLPDTLAPGSVALMPDHAVTYFAVWATDEFLAGLYHVEAYVTSGGGSVAPAEQVVVSGDAARVTITPSAGHKLTGITVNGVAKAPPSLQPDGTYSFETGPVNGYTVVSVTLARKALHLDKSSYTVEYANKTLEEYLASQGLVLTVTGEPGETPDYTVDAAGAAGKLNAGVYTLTVRGTNGYAGVTASATLTVTRRSLTSDMVADISPQSYTGAQLRPEPAVTDPDIGLSPVPAASYTYSYGANTSAGAGAGTVTVTGRGNYTGSVVKSFDIAENLITIVPDPGQGKTYGAADPDTLTYKAYTDYGEAAQSEYHGISGLLRRVPGETVGSGYSFDLSGLSAPGASLTLEDSVKFSITPKSIGNGTDRASDIHVSPDPIVLGYTDSPAQVAAQIIYQSPALNTLGLVPGTDYAFLHYDGAGSTSYSSSTAPTDAGSYTVTITARGSNYAGSFKLPFTIDAAAGTLGVQISGGSTVTYQPAGYTPSIAVTDRTGGAVNAYTAVYTKDGGSPTAFVSGETVLTDAGVYTVDVTGSGNWSGSSGSAVLVILPKNLAQGNTDNGTNAVVLDAVADQTYDGTAKTPSVRLTYGTADLTGSDCSVTYYNNVEAGSASIVIVGHGNYTGSRTTSFTISRLDISGDDRFQVTAPGNVVYNGGEQKQAPAVTYKGTALTEGRDYTLSYSADAANAGEVTVTVHGAGSFSGSKTAAYQILPKTLTDHSTISVADIGVQTYTGDAITPTPAVTYWSDAGAALSLTAGADRDFTVTYAVKSGSGGTLDGSGRPVGVGAYTILISGTGNYTDSCSVEFTIAAASGGLIVTTNLITKPYIGTNYDLIALIEVKDGTKKLTFGTDYTLGTENVRDVNTYVVPVTGINGYHGSTAQATVVITPAVLTGITTGSTSLTYDGTPKAPEITAVTAGALTLTGADYTVAYRDASGNVSSAKPSASGDYTMVVTGQGNFTGTAEQPFTISANELTVGMAADHIYNGMPYLPEPEIMDGTAHLTRNTDYTLDYTPTPALNAGAYTIHVSGAGSYTGKTGAAGYRILPKKLDDSDHSGKITAVAADAVYTGAALEPAVVVTYTTADGRALLLTKGSDYDLAYSGNLNAGQGTVVITGKGNYTGERTEHFIIAPAGGQTLGVAVTPVSKVYSGAEQTPVITVTDGTATLTADTDYTVHYTALSGQLGSNGLPQGAGVYTVTVTGQGNYANFSGSAAFVITPAELADAAVTGAYTYDGTEQRASVTVRNAGGGTLTEGTDYELVYRNNIGAGMAMVTVVGKGSYSGTLNQTFSIARAELIVTPTNTGKVYGEPDGELAYHVSGQPAGGAEPILTGALTRTHGEAADDYSFFIHTLSEASGNYTLKLAPGSTFTITPKDIGVPNGSGGYTGASADGIEETLTENGLTMGYTGAAFDGTLAIAHASELGRLLLSKDTDYTLGSVSPDAGIHDVTVTGKGNYTGEFTFRLTISEAVLGVSINGGGAVTYNGKDQKPGLDGLTATGVNGTPQNIQIQYLEADGTTETNAFKDAGRYRLVVSADNYESVQLDFVVLPKQLAPGMVSDPDGVTYNGQVHKPAVNVSDRPEGTDILLQTDYTVRYGTNTAVGQGTVAVTAQGNYTGTVTKTFAIGKLTLTGGNTQVGSLSDPEYNGTAWYLEPAVQVDLDGDGSKETTLVRDRDYTLSYTGDASNVTADGVTVAVTGIGSYEGVLAAAARYHITPRAIQPGWITVIPSQIAYTGSALEPAVAVYDGSIRLTAGTDYTVAYSGNTEKGTAIATVTGHGNYIGAPTASFTISSNTGSLTVTMRPDGSAVYDGGNHKPALEVKSGTNDATYAAVYSYNGTDMGAFGADTQFVDAGTYVITVTGTGSYEGAAGRVVFVVRPAAFTVGAVADQNYDGTPKTPKPMVKNNSGADLTEGIDYLLSYTNNVARGTATITVIGQGNYAGYSSSVTFSITGSSTVFGITYDGNGSTGGTVPVDSKEYLIGGQATVLSGTPTVPNAVFLGWVPDVRPSAVAGSQAEQDAYPVLYRAGDSFTVTANTTLYALWGKDADNNSRPDYAETLAITASAGSGGSITPDRTTSYRWGDQNVAYTIQADSGYTFSGLMVDGVEVKVSTAEAPTALVRNDDGSYTYTFAAVTEDHVILATFRQNGGGGGGGGGGTPPDDGGDERPMPDRNPDVPPLHMDDHFAYIQGTGAAFEPNAKITRGQVAAILARLMCGGMDIPGGGASRFSDVSPDAWYYDSVAYLEQYDIILGVGDGTFQPDRAITRAEFAAMMMRFFITQKYEGDPIFSDLNASHWAYDYINEAHAYGFVLGYTDGTFGPDQNIRRAEAVAILNRVLDRQADKAYVGSHLEELVTYPDVTPSHWAYYDILEASNGHDFTHDTEGNEVWEQLWDH